MAFQRALGVAASQTANRVQSILFAAAEALGLYASRLGDKLPIPLPEQPDIQATWANRDLPGPYNVYAQLPPRNAAGCYIDLDIDLHKISGIAWTEDDDALAETIAARVQAFLELMLKTQFRHVWGRASQNGTGHVYLRLEGHKAAIDTFQQRTGGRAFRIGNFSFRIEARLPSPKGVSGKTITLPGSIYPARSGHGVDPLVWNVLDTTLTTHSPVFSPIEALRADEVANAIYAATLGIVAVEQWTDGNRHDAALRVTGVLARDIVDELLTEEQAKAILGLICNLANDPDPQDRMKALETSIALFTSGGVVSGFGAFADFFGTPATEALLRLRGKGDPSAFDTLRDIVVYAQSAEGVEDVYLDMEAVYSGALINTHKAIRNHFNTDQRFPAIKTAKGKVPLIDTLLASPRLRKVPEARKYPGIAPGTMMMVKHDAVRPATEEEILNERCILNIGPGYATARVEEPDPEAMRVWLHHWKTYLGPLCHNHPAHTLRLERAIALKIKEPLRKLALGICLTGDGGIGKSSLCQTILPAILGNVVGELPIAGIDRSPYFASDLSGRLFMLADEADLASFRGETLESVKNLMKSPLMRVNAKYGAERNVHNYALPIFTTNSPNPTLTIRGQRERSLFVIQGDTAENMSMSTKEWTRYTAKIKNDMTAFVRALNRQDVREAALHYFLNFDIDLARVDLVETNPDGGFSDLLSPRDALDPVQEVFVQMLERGTIHPRLIDHDIMQPFKMDWVIAVVSAELRKQKRTRSLTPHGVTKLINALFRDPHVRDSEQEPAIAATQPSGKSPIVGESRTTYPQLRYLTLGYGLLLERLKQNHDVVIEPVFEIHPDDLNHRPRPSNADLWRVAQMQFDVDRL